LPCATPYNGDDPNKKGEDRNARFFAGITNKKGEGPSKTIRYFAEAAALRGSTPNSTGLYLPWKYATGLKGCKEHGEWKCEYIEHIVRQPPT
jgi:hypothetical protein